MDYRIFNVCTDVNVCDCTWVCADTCKRVRTESWLWEKNPLLHQGIEPASMPWWSDAVPTELHPHPILLPSEAATIITLIVLQPLCCVCTNTMPYLPAPKLHFQEPNSPKSTTLHDFMEHISKHIPTFLKKTRWPDFTGKSQGNLHVCTSLTESAQLRMLFANQSRLSTSSIISQDYCELQSSRKCHVSCQRWLKATSHGVVSEKFGNISFSLGMVLQACDQKTWLCFPSYSKRFHKWCTLIPIHLACSFAETSVNLLLLRVFRASAEHFRE